MTFSQRMKLIPVRDVVQVESLDNETRTALWNIILPFIVEMKHEYHPQIARSIWVDLYHQPADTVPDMRKNIYENASNEELYCRFFRSKIMNGTWNECLDFIEYIADEKRRKEWNSRLYDYIAHTQKSYVPGRQNFNAIFEQYMVGYRFIDGEIVPITSKTEVAAIEYATSNSKPSVKELLLKALHHLSDRAKPDYAKSIECSISAVESQCCLLLGKDKVTLGDALKRLEETQGVKLHEALKGALLKLYGFTSDADGIRHGTIKPSDVDQELAKFMLIVCSAFVNYLIAQEG